MSEFREMRRKRQQLSNDESVAILVGYRTVYLYIQ